MVKGDIVHYKHREGMEFYGIVRRNPDERYVPVSLLLSKRYDGTYEWNNNFVAKRDRVTVLEAV